MNKLAVVVLMILSVFCLYAGFSGKEPLLLITLGNFGLIGVLASVRSELSSVGLKKRKLPHKKLA